MSEHENEHWENVIECEFEFYKTFKAYQAELLDYLKENAVIRLPMTVFDEELGEIYLSCPGTEAQALRRIEIKERIDVALKRAEKRMNRLLNSIRKLEKSEQEIAFIILENATLADMAMKLGQPVTEFLRKKENVLKKLYAVYEKERDESIQERENATKEAVLKKAALFKKSLLNEVIGELDDSEMG